MLHHKNDNSPITYKSISKRLGHNQAVVVMLFRKLLAHLIHAETSGHSKKANVVGNARVLGRDKIR